MVWRAASQTEAVGQRRAQRSLCCRHISAADIAEVPFADANPGALLSMPCSGQCGVLELLQYTMFHIMLGHAHMAALACCIDPDAKAHACGRAIYIGSHLL